MPIPKTKFVKSLKKNSPKILKLVGLIGMIGTPVLTTYSTVKAVRAYDKRKEELGVEKLPVKETVKTCWKYYIAPFSLMGASTASMISGESISLKRTELISAACNAAEQTLADYKEETRNKLGETKAREIERDTLVKQAEEARKLPNLMIQGEGNGGTLFYEPVTGTFFYSTRNKVDKAFNELSAQMLRENYVELGDLFYLLDLRIVEACHGYGWNSMRVKTIEPDCLPTMDDETYESYTVMSYKLWPTTNYMDI